MDKLAALAEKRRVEREAAHARAVVGINTAVEAAEQVETTPQALMASYHDLRAIGVGRGDWASLVQQIGGYGPSLQEAIVRLGARMARTLAALAVCISPTARKSRCSRQIAPPSPAPRRAHRAASAVS